MAKKATKMTTEQPTLEVQASVDTKAVFDGFWLCKGKRPDIVKAETEEGARIFYQEINGYEAATCEPCSVQPLHQDVVVCSLIETDGAGKRTYHLSRSTYLGS